MININKIKIYVAEFTNEHQLIGLDMFDVSTIIGNLFVGLSIESQNILDEFTDFEHWTHYNLLDINYITDPTLTEVVQVIKDYTCVFHDLNDVVDTMLDGVEFNSPDGYHVNIDKYCREIYLRSVIYYKNNQEGKKRNFYKLKVKHFDDFAHEFAEDLISTEVLHNNSDFSESDVLIETYLTDNEINDKFKEYIIA